MLQTDLTKGFQKVGRLSCLAVFILGLAYAITTTAGLLTLPSADEPISNPYFSIMEILTILIAPLMAISMVAVHYFAAPADKIYSLIAVIFMFLMTGITSCVHFVVLSMGQQEAVAQLSNPALFFSFRWPSVVYVLDILAWDWFFALSMLFAASVFRRNGPEKKIRLLMIISGVLSLAGLLGIPFGNMQIRNIGIIGYAVLAPVIFFLLSKIFKTARE